MSNLTKYEVRNTGNVIDITLSRVVMTENGARKTQQGMSFFDTEESYQQILKCVNDATKWTVD